MRKSVALIFATNILLLAGCSTTPKTAHWEYKTKTLYLRAGLNPEILNANAKEGWEFVSATVIPNDSGEGAVAVFKRRIK